MREDIPDIFSDSKSSLLSALRQEDILSPKMFPEISKCPPEVIIDARNLREPSKSLTWNIFFHEISQNAPVRQADNYHPKNVPRNLQNVTQRTF